MEVEGGGRTDTNSYLGRFDKVYCTVSMKLTPWSARGTGEVQGKNPQVYVLEGGGNFLGKFGEELRGACLVCG